MAAEGLSRRAFSAALAGAPVALKAALGATGPGAAATGKLRAFVAGNSAYFALPRLRTAVADARAVAQRLTQVGYLTTEAIDCDAAALRKRLGEFAAGIEPGTTAVLYFAGHGLQISGSNYFLASDYAAGPGGGVTGALALSEALAEVAGAGPDNCLAIVDACRNNPRPASAGECAAGLASVQAPRGFYIAYSAGSGQTAMDRIDSKDASPNGLFARYLVPNLQASFAVDDIIKRTRIDVARVAASVGHAQHPAIYDQSSPFTLAGEPLTFERGGIVVNETSLIGDAIGLVVGVDWFRSRSHIGQYPGALNDANNFSLSLEEHGVALYGGDVMINPAQSALLEACEKIAAMDKRVIFYFAGPGFQHGGDGYLGTPSDTPGDPFTAATSVMQIARRLGRATKPVLMALDNGLPQYDMAEEALDLTRAPSPEEVLSRYFADSRRPGGLCFGDVAMVYSSNFFQVAQDMLEGAINSPFEIALANALCRPGLTMAELVELVRAEVVNMTAGSQTPIYIGPRAPLDHVWVTPKPDPAGPACAA